MSKYAEIKNNSNNGRFAVVDNKDMMFMINDNEKVHPSYDVGIWANTQFFSSALSNMFDHTWDKMK